MLPSLESGSSFKSLFTAKSQVLSSGLRVGELEI